VSTSWRGTQSPCGETARSWCCSPKKSKSDAEFERLIAAALEHRLRRSPHQLLDERRAYAADAARGFPCEPVFDTQHASVTPDEQPALGFSGQADFNRLIHAAGPHGQRRFQHFRPVGGKHE
jgi:hypothetical protein